LSILPVLMAGLYIFWVFVLLGGQVTYAVQNVHHRSSRSAWEGLNQESRESLSLLLLVLIGRRFAECLPPYTATQLSEAMHVPTQVVNESLNRLMDLQLVTMTPAVNESSLDYHYQVARPLSRITLLEFRDAFAALGTIPAGARLDSIDPVLAHFRERLAAAHRQALGEQNLEELFAQIAAPPHRARPTPV
jgi:membrane protein